MHESASSRRSSLRSAPAPMGVTLREASGFSALGIPYAFWTFVFGYTLGPSLLDLHLDRSAAALARHAPVLGLGLAASVGLPLHRTET